MKKKSFGLIVLLLTYIFAALIGVGIFLLLEQHIHYLLAILIGDVIATVFVWLIGIIFKTASMYDPYWSLQTLVIYTCLLFYFNNFTFFTVVPLVAIFLYSIRLTANFVIGFHDLTYVDWRYKMLASKSGKLFQLVNLFGICMFPTLVVYLASVPLFIYVSLDGFSWLDMIGSAVILAGTLLELVADVQMKSFIKNRTSRAEIINVGLWNYSRHPNYLGEIAIWFGVAFVLILARLHYWPWFVGSLVNLLMFLFISIPMEEKNMKEYKPGMEDYISSTSCLLILPRKK